MKNINKNGISLILLIITVIVIIILAAVVILTIQKNNPVDSAKEAAFKEDIYNFKTELELYKAKASQNGEDVTKLYANKETDPSIKDVITSISRKYLNKLEVRDGKLAYIGKDKFEYLLAKNMDLIPEDALLDDDILTELKPFITEWTVEAGDSITLPIRGKCNFTVDYGDGTGVYKVTSATNENRIHTYENAGTYTVTIKGSCDQFVFNLDNVTSKDKITKIVQWGDLGVIALYFGNCTNLSGNIPEPSINSFKNITSFREIFISCSNLTGEIPGNLFRKCPNVTSFYGTFKGCSGLTGTIPKNLFSNCTKLTELCYTFNGCQNITGTISSDLFKNNINVTNLGGIFNGCSNLTGEIPSNLLENLTKVTNVGGMFFNCSNLTGNIPESLFANCPNITSFRETFLNCRSLTGEIPQNLFSNCLNVSDFYGTFSNCTGLSGNAIDLWNRDNVKSSQYCYRNCTQLSNYNDIPSGWK